MNKTSAGLLMYRIEKEGVEVFLVHPGGPYWANKDEGIWSIPKGEFLPGEDPFEAAKREFAEETGFRAFGDFKELTPIRQKSGKKVFAWAIEGSLDASELRSNTFTIEWPPKSGKQQAFPEVDKGEWFSISQAKVKIVIGQIALLDELMSILI